MKFIVDVPYPTTPDADFNERTAENVSRIIVNELYRNGYGVVVVEPMEEK